MAPLHFWRDIAIIVLAVEAILFGIIPLVAFYLGIRGLAWAERQVRHYGSLARRRWREAHARVARWADRIRHPFKLRNTFTQPEGEAHR